MTAEELTGALKVMDALQDNLTATQARCTELILENRMLLKRIAQMEARWLELLREPQTDAKTPGW
jgi:hypothetical protein